MPQQRTPKTQVRVSLFRLDDIYGEVWTICVGGLPMDPWADYPDLSPGARVRPARHGVDASHDATCYRLRDDTRNITIDADGIEQAVEQWAHRLGFTPDLIHRPTYTPSESDDW